MMLVTIPSYLYNLIPYIILSLHLYCDISDNSHSLRNSLTSWGVKKEYEQNWLNSRTEMVSLLLQHFKYKYPLYYFHYRYFGE